jgi:hypothetical protein
MDNKKEELLDKAAEQKAETFDKKVALAKAKLQEKVDDVKIGAVDLKEKASEKWDDLKENASETWEKTKQKAEELKKDIKEKLD